MDNFYVVSSGSYSDYGINFIFKSPNEITEEQFRKYHLESIKKSSNFDDRQNEKLARLLNDDSIKSTNYYSRFPLASSGKPIISFQSWLKLCKDAGVEENPSDWLQKILIENGCEIVKYKEFNTDDWD